MENKKVSFKEQLGAIMIIVTFGYWFRMGQRWADKQIESWKKICDWAKELIGTFIHKDEVHIEDPMTEDYEY